LGGATATVTRQRTVAGGALIVAASAVLAWALARQQNSLAVTLVRAAADGSAVVTLGLAVVPMLDIDRYRGELIRRATAPLTIAGAVWLVAELLRLVVAAAQAAAVPVTWLGLQTTVDFALHTAPGRSGLFSAVAAALGVCDRAGGTAFGGDERRGRGWRGCRAGGAPTHRAFRRE
jgi:copper resistance protein D